MNVILLQVSFLAWQWFVNTCQNLVILLHKISMEGSNQVEQVVQKTMGENSRKALKTTQITKIQHQGKPAKNKIYDEEM